MPNAGDDLVDNIEDALSFKKQRQSLSDAVDKVKGYFGANTSAANQPSKPDTAWHDSQVDAATASFKKPDAAPTKPQKPVPKYEKGTDYVPKTGPAILHKGEAVLNKEDAKEHRKNMKSDYMHGAKDDLAGKKEEKPKKEVKEIRTRKGKSGGYIHEHHHTAPEHHPMEEHTSPDQDSMMDHMMQNMGQPNPGEAEADAGQSGIPGAAQASAPSGGAPAAAAPQMGA